MWAWELSPLSASGRVVKGVAADRKDSGALSRFVVVAQDLQPVEPGPTPFLGLVVVDIRYGSGRTGDALQAFARVDPGGSVCRGVITRLAGGAAMTVGPCGWAGCGGRVRWHLMAVLPAGSGTPQVGLRGIRFGRRGGVA